MPKKHNYDWNELIKEQRDSGMNMKKYCREKDIPYGCFKNHKYALQEMQTPLSFVPIGVNQPEVMKLSINETNLVFDTSIDDISLRRILKALTS